MARLLEIVAGTLAILLAIYYSVYVEMTLWNWFLAPLGLPEVGMLRVMGISMALSFLLSIHRLAREQSVEKLTAKGMLRSPRERYWLLVATAFGAAGFAHGFGAIIHTYGG